MELKDIKAGMKVVVISKSIGDCEEDSNVFRECKEQGFLYVDHLFSDLNTTTIVLDYKTNSGTGDYFLPQDLVPYIDIKDKYKVGDKVVALTKTIGCCKEDSNVFIAGQKQGFLYITTVKKHSLQLSEEPIDLYGDYFNFSDVVPYVESEKMEETKSESEKVNSEFAVSMNLTKKEVEVLLIALNTKTFSTPEQFIIARELKSVLSDAMIPDIEDVLCNIRKKIMTQHWWRPRCF